MGFSSGWQGCSEGNPLEQSCQPLENPVHPSSFTLINPVWIGLKFALIIGQPHFIWLGRRFDMRYRNNLQSHLAGVVSKPYPIFSMEQIRQVFDTAAARWDQCQCGWAQLRLLMNAHGKISCLSLFIKLIHRCCLLVNPLFSSHLLNKKKTNNNKNIRPQIKNKTKNSRFALCCIP